MLRGRQSGGGLQGFCDSGGLLQSKFRGYKTDNRTMPRFAYRLIIDEYLTTRWDMRPAGLKRVGLPNGLGPLMATSSTGRLEGYTEKLNHPALNCQPCACSGLRPRCFFAIILISSHNLLKFLSTSVLSHFHREWGLSVRIIPFELKSRPRSR